MFEFAVTQILLGLTLGSILTLVAAGLSLIFGVMNVINFAHGSLLMLGAYFGVLTVSLVGNFWLALLLAPLPVALIGFLIEYFGIRPLQGRDPLWHLLLTVGLSLIFRNAVNLIWGPRVQSISVPDVLQGAVVLGGIFYPTYRLFALLFSGAVAFAVWLFIRRSRYGLAIRAGAHDPEMVDALGVDISKVFTLVFVLGAAMAGAAGVIIGPIRSIYPEMGMDHIIQAFIIVVIGGLGSFGGAVAGALVLGLTESLSALFLPPDFVQVPTYALMALILLLRPTGLLGDPEVIRH